MDIFEIKEITKYFDDDAEMVSGIVCFHHQEPLGDKDVGQVIEIEVRINPPTPCLSPKSMKHCSRKQLLN